MRQRTNFAPPFAADDVRLLGSGAEVPERRAKRIVGHRQRFEAVIAL